MSLEGNRNPREAYENAPLKEKESVLDEARDQALAEDSARSSEPAEAPAIRGERPVGVMETAEVRNVMASMSPENGHFFSKMTERGQEVLLDAYKDLSEAPSKTVGKMQIAFNQFWADRHEGKAAGLKREMDNLSLQIDALDQAKGKFASSLNALQLKNVPGLEAMQLQLKDIDNRKVGLLNKRDAVQSRFESRDNKVKLYANERDRIADKFIGNYDERLAPMEEKLETLESQRDEADLLIATTESRHKEELVRLAALEKQKADIEGWLREVGLPEKKIKESVSSLAETLAQGRKDIQTEGDRLAKQRAKIDKQVAQADARANPYRDKREQFIRAKENRPLEMNVATREKSRTEPGIPEEIKSHTRTEAETAPEAVISEAAAEEPAAPEANPERINVVMVLDEWNNALKRSGVKDVPPIDQKDFLKRTRLSTGATFDIDDIKKVLGSYYKLKKLPKDAFDRTFATFIIK